MAPLFLTGLASSLCEVGDRSQQPAVRALSLDLSERASRVETGSALSPARAQQGVRGSGISALRVLGYVLPSATSIKCALSRS